MIVRRRAERILAKRPIVAADNDRTDHEHRRKGPQRPRGAGMEPSQAKPPGSNRQLHRPLSEGGAEALADGSPAMAPREAIAAGADVGNCDIA